MAECFVTRSGPMGRSRTRIALKIIAPRFVSCCLCLSISLEHLELVLFEVIRLKQLLFLSTHICCTQGDEITLSQILVNSLPLLPINPPPSLGILHMFSLSNLIIPYIDCLFADSHVQTLLPGFRSTKTTWLQWWIQSILFMRNCWILFWTYAPESSKGIKVQPPGLWWLRGTNFMKFHTLGGFRYTNGKFDDWSTSKTLLQDTTHPMKLSNRFAQFPVPRCGFASKLTSGGLWSNKRSNDQLQPVGCGSPLGCCKIGAKLQLKGPFYGSNHIEP